MKKVTKILLVSLVLVVLLTVIIGVGNKYTEDKKPEIPEGNFTVLSINENLFGDGEIIVLYDNDRNATLYIYRGNAKGGMWGYKEQFNANNVSNNCSCT